MKTSTGDIEVPQKPKGEEPTEASKEDLFVERGKDLEDAKQKAEEYLTRLRYLQAEFDNYRKRTERDFGEAKKFGTERVIVRLLDLKDDMDRALDIVKNSGGASVLEGLGLISKNLDHLLEEEGVKVIEAAGKPLDPSRHDVVSFVDRDDVEENMVTSELRRGYTIHDKVIRSSMVEVARKSKEKVEVEAVSEEAE